MPRIVQCPRCRSLLQEPPPGNPFYQCGTCSTTLQAKHATRADLEALKRRTSPSYQQTKNSVVDSSSGVADDELAGTTNGNDPSLHSRRDLSELPGGTLQSSTETVAEPRSHVIRDTSIATSQQQGPPQETGVDPYVQSPETPELNLKQLALDTVSSADHHLRTRTAQDEIGSIEVWPSSLDVSPYANSAFQVERTQVRNRTEDIPAAQSNMMSSAGRENGTETLGGSDSRINGVLSASVGRQSRTSHLPHAYSGLSSESVQATGHNDDLNRGRPRNDEPNANNNQKPPTGAGNMGSEASRTKLRWQAREPDSPGAGSSKGISEDDNRISQGDDKYVGHGSVKETASMDTERNWRAVGNRRFLSSEDRRLLDEQGAAGQQLVRSPSQDSDLTSDMYENPASIGEYEPSETSSTATFDEVESNHGMALGRASSEVGRNSPPSDQGIPRSASRPNLHRSNASSGSAFSEESISDSPQTEMMIPGTHPDKTRMMGGVRSHSWDERGSLMGAAAAAAAAGNLGPHQGPLSVRQKSSSHDYDSSLAKHLQRVSSDPCGNYRTDPLQGNLASLYDSPSPRQPLASSLRPSSQNYQHQQWANRYVPPSLPGQHSPSLQQWSPNSSSRSHFPEQSALQPPRPSYSSRQMSGQLPPKQGHFPPLPPPGALPHVLCQYCRVLLAVPSNLPPTTKSTQKLRCGSCRKISIFSVPHVEDSGAASVPFSSRSESQHGQSSLASGLDSQAELTSATKSSSVAETLSGRSLSGPDLGEKQVERPLPRYHSLGNEGLIAPDQEIPDRALWRAEVIASDSSNPTPGSSVRSFSSVTSNFSDALPSDSTELNNTFENKSGTGPIHRRREGSGSENDLLQPSVSGIGSPQFNQSSFKSPPHLNSPSLHDLRSSGSATDHAATEQVHEARGLNKALKGLFGIRKNKHVTGGGQYRKRVVVNGVPIPDHLARKAEEQAGPIHPGTYWYDSQAGFWGVAGGQCLGIIPPFIEEFNHPMSRDCAGGRTGILVNGRELHHVDREKLLRRGLPDTPRMSYRIEIDGRVIDMAKGTELKGLGRLAPTLESKGRGSGMYVPSNISGGSKT